jgi:hypothetical protein
VTYDEIRSVIYAPSSEDHRGNEVTEEFGFIDEFSRTLKALGDEQWYAYVPCDEGPGIESNVGRNGGTARRDEHGVIEFFVLRAHQTVSADLKGSQLRRFKREARA